MIKTRQGSIQKKKWKEMIKQIYKILKTENNRGLLRYLIIAMSKKKNIINK